MARIRPIRDIAEPKGFNISTLAKGANISYPTAHTLWHGHVVRVDLDTLSAVARVLAIRVRDLIEEDEVSDPKIAMLDLPAAA